MNTNLDPHHFKNETKQYNSRTFTILHTFLPQDTFCGNKCFPCLTLKEMKTINGKVGFKCDTKEQNDERMFDETTVKSLNMAWPYKLVKFTLSFVASLY